MDHAVLGETQGGGVPRVGRGAAHGGVRVQRRRGSSEGVREVRRLAVRVPGGDGERVREGAAVGVGRILGVHSPVRPLSLTFSDIGTFVRHPHPRSPNLNYRIIGNPKIAR